MNSKLVRWETFQLRQRLAAVIRGEFGAVCFNRGLFLHGCFRLGYVAFVLVFGALLDPRLSKSSPIRESQTSATRADTNRALKPGTPQTSAIDGTESHVFQMRLEAGQFTEVVVDQRGIDLTLKLFSPDGRELATRDWRGRGLEALSAIAESAGDYRLELRSKKPSAPTGQYEIRLSSPRTPTPADRSRVIAEDALSQALQFRESDNAQSIRQALKKAEESLPLWQELGDSRSESYTLALIGELKSDLAEPRSKILPYYEKALPLSQSSGDRYGEARVLNNMGSTYRELGDSAKAIEYLEKALELRQSLQDRELVANTMNHIGGVHIETGNYPKALDYFTQALSILHSTGDRGHEGLVLSNIGGIYRHLGELQKSLNAYRQALELHRAVGDRRAEATTLGNLGGVYEMLGEYQTALEHSRDTLKIRKEIGDRRGEAFSLNNMGLAYERIGEKENAIQAFRQSLEIRKATGDQRGEAIVLNNLSNVYRSSGQFQEALDLQNRALPLRRSVGDRSGLGKSLRNIGTIYEAMGDQHKAVEFYSQALDILGPIGDRDALATAYAGLARSWLAQGELEKAKVEVEKALTEIESQRGVIASPELRASYLGVKQGFFGVGLELFKRLHDQSPAGGHDVAMFSLCERSKARSLLDMLGEANVDLLEGIDPAIRQKERTLQARLSSLQSRLMAQRSRERSDKSQIALLEAQLKQADSERLQLEEEIRQSHPRFALFQDNSSFSVAQARQLLKEGSVLLEYWLGEPHSYLFAISRSDYRVLRLPKASVFAEGTQKLLQALASPRRTALATLLAESRHLYRELIEPVQPLIAKQRELIIVPDGPLHYVPFEILLKDTVGPPPIIDPGALPYLIRDVAISYAPSAAALSSLQERRIASVQGQRALLALADPDFGPLASRPPEIVREALRTAFASSTPGKLDPLPQSRVEVEKISQLFPAAAAKLLLGSQASEQRLRMEATNNSYRILHFATHGLLNESRPGLSGLVLSLSPMSGHEPVKPPEKEGQIAASNTGESLNTEDGLLQVYEIFKLKLNADLVVLSACETGLGKEIKGEGLLGLTRAFLYAGSPSVMVSLWKVADRSTAELMTAFYKKLNQGLTKTEALRQAQLEMIRKGRYAHPYYWAPFVLVGRSG